LAVLWEDGHLIKEGDILRRRGASWESQSES